MTDRRAEFPKSWFTRAKLARGRREASLNVFVGGEPSPARGAAAACERGDLKCRRRQRQALLRWAYDSGKI